MRKTYEATLKRCLHDKIVTVRKKQQITQEKMAELLIMDPRSYADIENGKNACSSVTLMLYMIHFCDDPNQLVAEIEQLFSEARGENDATK